MANTIRSATGDAAALARDFLTQVIPSPRQFDIRLWDGTLIRGEQDTHITMRVASPGAVKRMFRPPLELNLAEAYMRGDFEVEGSLIDILQAANGVMDAPRLLRDMPKLAPMWAKLPNDPPQRDIERRHVSRAGLLGAGQM